MISTFTTEHVMYSKITKLLPLVKNHGILLFIKNQNAKKYFELLNRSHGTPLPSGYSFTRENMLQNL